MCLCKAKCVTGTGKLTCYKIVGAYKWNDKNSYFTPYMLGSILTEHMEGEREFESGLKLEDKFIEQVRMHPEAYNIEGGAVHSYKDQDSAVSAMVATFVPSRGRWYEVWECEIDLDKVDYCMEGEALYGHSYASSSLRFVGKIIAYTKNDTVMSESPADRGE